MKKETYLRKLASTVITDENTVGEAKAAEKTKTELHRFLKNAAIQFVREMYTADARLFDAPYTKFVISCSLKETGSVTVKLLDTDKPVPYAPHFQEIKEYRVRKKNLFS